MKPALKYTLVILVILAVVAGAVVYQFVKGDPTGPPAMDEAMRDHKTPADFPHATADFFHDMDGGGQMTPEEIKGRNTWMVWTGGNEAFWDYLAGNSFGTFDLLKTLSSYPCTDDQRRQLTGLLSQNPKLRSALPSFGMYRRSWRFRYLGLMNEPGFTEPTAPDEYGLCLDRSMRSTPDFDEKVYGRASGVLGLRIYPNPAFAAARAKWDATKFYTDPNYYSDASLVRPYRVGMACSFCHVSHRATSPPADPENPEFVNLSGTIGAQYFWFGRIFAPNAKPNSFVGQLIDTAQPGAVDTSFIPTDHINNPRAMNSIFNLGTRVAAGQRFHEEAMEGRALDLPEIKPLWEKQGRPSSVAFRVPHILWDGADSVGVDAALTRVYINIGEYHQEWIRHIQPLVGGRPQTPIEVKVAQQYSTYWNATQERSGDMARYLIKASAPTRLTDLPSSVSRPFLQGARSDADYAAALTRGKTVFAETCARCHSSKLPQPAPGLDEGLKCTGANYRGCWDRYWAWTETEDFKSKMRPIVLDPAFLNDNYLSNDARIPVDVLGTEICSAMASNAVAGYVWDNFSSGSYKSLPAIPAMQLLDPLTGQPQPQMFTPPGGGRGYQRVPTLIGIWATAPFLHNNEVGMPYRYGPDGGPSISLDPSVEGRMQAFDDAIRKLLYLKPRENKIRRTEKVQMPGDSYGPGETYDGTTYLTVYVSALPERLQRYFGDGFLARTLRSVLGVSDLVSDGQIQLGPIPRGTPVNLLANINLDLHDPRFSILQLLRLLNETKKALRDIRPNMPESEVTTRMKQLEPQLLKLSTCPDFIVDRGHDFAKVLADQDKERLIDFLKTF